MVVGLNPPTQEKVIEKDRKEIEQDSNDAYIYDPQVKALTQNLEECKITEINNYDLPQNEPKQEPDLKCDGFSQVFPCPTASTTQQAESISNDPCKYHSFCLTNQTVNHTAQALTGMARILSFKSLKSIC